MWVGVDSQIGIASLVEPVALEVPASRRLTDWLEILQGTWRRCRPQVIFLELEHVSKIQNV